LLCFGAAIVLIWFGLADTRDAAWERHIRRMRASGISPERTEEWEWQLKANRFIALLAGVVLLLVAALVAYLRAGRLF
jgi:hypothetical protein